MCSLADSLEKWCHEHLLSSSALSTAAAIRAELVDIVRRIELPYAEPAFGSTENTLNLKKALVSGFFIQVSMALKWEGSSEGDSLPPRCSIGRSPVPWAGLRVDSPDRKLQHVPWVLGQSLKALTSTWASAFRLHGTWTALVTT